MKPSEHCTNNEEVDMYCLAASNQLLLLKLSIRESACRRKYKPL